MDDSLNQVLAHAVSLAESAGALLLDKFGQLASGEVGHKSASRDLVTAADLASEAFILRGLQDAFPDDSVLAEEDAKGVFARESGQTGSSWIVDPLDGTVNFVHGLPMWGVSIARMTDDKVDVAVVHLPRLQETFTAVLGGGAFLNGRPIQVSDAKHLADTVLATGFPYRRHVLLDDNLENFQRLFLHQRGVRRMGAAAVDLAYVAAGRLGAFWELHLAPWDVAAGGLLVQEAGGVVDTIQPSGDWLFGRNLLAGPEPLLLEMREHLLAGRDQDYPPLGEHPS
ncbi:MAG: inositol monophosphatase [Planctomycetes bacterium]|jgi:myo-inositol-1(or 4)-monophosphatase|nr:inositol monophosphatase [Planctomycetota bacterium]MBT4028435.1 inositol monophosphatase [Planctomycetota bacterium]MBT4559694.1 inositol monophosphatase [Planctomycetota bacterium]MBT5120896.1 inositol monophosphatase [Planctomycetota bacterium]MBT7011301.1 inositol monophosphatase [Planctomycetota bacterium]